MDFIFDPSLVFYLPLYQLNGASVMSEDAHGHLCSVTGALWRPNGRYFDGTDDLIQANTVANNGLFGGAHTLIAWARLAAWGANREIIAGGRTDVTSEYSMIGYTNADKFVANNDLAGAPAGNQVLSSKTYANDANWHFLTSVVDADGHINQFVVDGIAEGSDSSNNLDLSTLNKFYIGQLPWTSANVNPWQGSIGEVWVYQRELTPLEIQNLYLTTKWRYR